MNLSEALKKFGQTPIDEYLHRIGDRLQLSPSQKDNVEKSYEALVNYIENNSEIIKEFEEVKAYAQGSYALQTVNKPLRTENFDIDIVVEFSKRNYKIGPKAFYESLLKIFQGESKYKDIVEPKNRCVRINYISSNYYFDILPVVPGENSQIKYAPDRSMGDWVRTSPKKYREWFEKRCETSLLTFNERMNLEKLPKDNLPFELKPALKRSVQLIKRIRDLYFKDNDEFKTSSIILTTLLAEYYEGQQSPYNALYDTIKKLNNFADDFKLLNPVDEQEEFTEKWHEDEGFFENFKNFIYYCKTNLEEIQKESGLSEKLKILAKLFGESIINDIVKLNEEWHKNGDYGVDKDGKLVTENFVNKAKYNNFYGKK